MMGQYSAWEHWIQGNVVIVMLVVTLGFALLLYLSKRQRDLYKEFQAKKESLNSEIEEQRKKLEDSEISKLVVQIKNLVEQIQFLFARHDSAAADIKKVQERVGIVEKQNGEQHIRCNEREKYIVALNDRLEDNISKYNNAILNNIKDAKTARREG